MTIRKAVILGLALLIPHTANAANERIPAARDANTANHSRTDQGRDVPLWILQQAMLRPQPQTPKAGAKPSPKIRAVALGRQLKPAFDLAQARACETQLKALGVRFTVAPPIGKGRSCGWQRPLKVTRLPDGVQVIGNLRLRCETALALAKWTRASVLPEARRHLNAQVTAMDVGSSYSCRRRNNKRRGKLSEHAFANAIDLMSIHLGTEPVMNVRRQKNAGRKAFQKAIRAKSCDYFNTVIGPGQAYHGDHLHLDLALHKGGGKYCK